MSAPNFGAPSREFDYTATMLRVISQEHIYRVIIAISRLSSIASATCQRLSIIGCSIYPLKFRKAIGCYE